MLRILAIPGVIYLLYKPQTLAQQEWAGCLFALALITDFFDGLLARKMQAITPLGKIMDPVADKLMIITGLVMILHLGYINVIWVILLIGREVVVNSLRTLAGNYGISIPSVMSARVKVFAEGFGIGFLMGGPDFQLWGIRWETVGHWCILLSVILASWSALYYFFHFYKYLKHADLTS